MASTVLAIFNDRAQADAAVTALQGRGYNAKDLSIIMRETVEGGVPATNAANSAATGAVSGATTGGALGALAGLLVGVGALTIPGLGAVLVGGPIVAALGLTGAAATTVSAAATGALAGGLLGALMGWGLPEETARYYEERIREGAVLLVVPVPEGTTDDIRAFLETKGAQQTHQVNQTW
ncbi:MAG TPA: general stress protein [Vitreimonas sp.]|nr:general stress protein [Vitreimonas sp.]